MREKIFLSQGAVTVEVKTKLWNALINIEGKRYLTSHPSIHATLIISVNNVKVGNQIHASDVDQRIISL